MGMQLKISDYCRIFYWYASLFLFIGKYLVFSHISIFHFELFRHHTSLWGKKKRTILASLISAMPLYGKKYTEIKEHIKNNVMYNN